MKNNENHYINRLKALFPRLRTLLYGRVGHSKVKPTHRGTPRDVDRLRPLKKEVSRFPHVNSLLSRFGVPAFSQRVNCRRIVLCSGTPYGGSFAGASSYSIYRYDTLPLLSTSPSGPARKKKVSTAEGRPQTVADEANQLRIQLLTLFHAGEPSSRVMDHSHSHLPRCRHEVACAGETRPADSQFCTLYTVIPVPLPPHSIFPQGRVDSLRKASARGSSPDDNDRQCLLKNEVFSYQRESMHLLAPGETDHSLRSVVKVSYHGDSPFGIQTSLTHSSALSPPSSPNPSEATQKSRANFSFASGWKLPSRHNTALCSRMTATCEIQTHQHVACGNEHEGCPRLTQIYKTSQLSGGESWRTTLNAYDSQVSVPNVSPCCKLPSHTPLTSLCVAFRPAALLSCKLGRRSLASGYPEIGTIPCPAASFIPW